MKLITVETCVAPADLVRAAGLVDQQADAVRAMKGCLHYALFHNPAGDGLAIVQRWDRSDHFEAYRSSEAFAALGAALRPLMTKPPVTTVAEVDTL